MLEEREIIQRLEYHEGFRSLPYKCSAGKTTIGIGRNLEGNPLTNEEIKVLGRKDLSKGITRQEAYYLLRNDIKKTIKDIKNNIPFFDNLDKERQYSIIDLCFNMGIDTLLTFKNTLASIGVGNYKNAAAQLLLSRYAKQVGIRAKRIAKLIETGCFYYHL